VQATRILAMRHGQTAWNAAGRIQGQIDVPLDAHGRWQADRLAQALSDEAIDVIYASDLSRAAQTAQAVAAATRLPVHTHAGLRERGFGVFEGLSFSEITRRWPQAADRWRRRDPGFGPAGGESLEEFYRRCVDAADALAGAHPGATVALVAHGGVLDCLYRAACRLDLAAARTWQLGNASINRLLHGDHGFSLVGWNDTAHLDNQSTDDFTDAGFAPAQPSA